MMKFYKVKILKRKIGSAVEHIPPELKGTIKASVYDMTTDGDYRLFVVECDKSQHKANLEMDEVTELTKEKAISLAEKYQPEMRIKQINPATLTEEEIVIPKCNLRAYL